MRALVLLSSRLESVLSICQTMASACSNAAVTSERVLYAKTYFDKATLHGLSIQFLLLRAKDGGGLDAGGISALARSLMETHNVFVYLTEAGISRGEREFRYRLIQLNQAVDLLRISEALGAGQKDFVFWQDAAQTALIADLQKNDVFLSFDEKQRTHLLRGRSPLLKNRYVGSRCVPIEIESAAYNLFSHNVHSYGLASSHLGESTPAGLWNLLFLSIEMSSIYLAHLAKRYRSIRPRSVGRESLADQAVLHEVLSLVRLHEWRMSVGEQPS